VPEFNSPGTHPITVRHLLTHTSGLRGTLPLKDAPDSATALTMVLTTVPVAPVGSRMVYSDLNAILLTNTTWTSPKPPDAVLDFLTAVYAAILD